MKLRAEKGKVLEGMIWTLQKLLTSKLSMNSMDSSVCDKGSLQDKLNIKLYEEKRKEEHWNMIVSL